MGSPEPDHWTRHQGFLIMLTSLLRFLKLLLPDGDKASPNHLVPTARHWQEEDIPRYPPFMQGLPVIPVENLLHTQTALIERIKNTTGITQTQFNQYYRPVIEKFSSYAHLLPASQSHHHRGAGGLFRHSLEVALYALQSSEKVLLDIAQTPAKRRELEPRLQLVTFLAALCHDAGKPVTDMTITNHDRSAIWRPIRESLHAWATRQKVTTYFLDWREGRNRQHTAMANLVADRIIGTEALAWIEEGSIELIIWLMESLNSNPSVTNPIFDLVIRADQASVERDLKTIGATMAGYDLGVPVERILTDIMRRLTKEGVWTINEPGARVWKLSGNTYLVWPAAGEDIARVIREERMLGLARTSEGILDMLVERDIAQIKEGQSPYWKIAPACLKEKIKDIRLQAIRLKDDVIVSAMPLQTVEGEVIDDTCVQLEAPEAATQSPSVKSSVIVEVNQEPPASLQTNQPAKKEAASLSQPALPVLPNELELDFPDNESGRILQVLRDAVASKRKQWGQDVLLDDNGYLLIRWPDAFSDCALPLKNILDALSDQKWLWIDPVTPWKKVVDAEINGQITKAIRLEKSISASLSGMSCKPVSSSREITSMSVKPETDKKPSLPLQQPAPSPEESSVKPESTTGKRGFPALKELIAIAQLEDIKADQDGWLVLDRKLLAKSVRAAGYRFTVVFLNSLVKDNPDRLSSEGTLIRLKL